MNINRSEAAALFYRLLKELPVTENVYNGSEYYADIEPSWYSDQVGYLHSIGVLEDYSRDGMFRPFDPVTRAEFATLASHFEALDLTGVNNFSDVPSGHWAEKYIKSAANKGWINGYDGGVFMPDANITRAEVAAVICRMLDRTADSQYLTDNATSLPKVFSDVAYGYWAYEVIMESAISHDYVKNDGSERWTAVYP